MTWDTLLEQGREAVRRNAQDASRRRAREHWANLLQAGAALRMNMPLAVPPHDSPPEQFSEGQKRWLLGWRTPLDPQVVIHVPFWVHDGRWVPVLEYGPDGIPGSYLVPNFIRVRRGDAHWIEWGPPSEWLYAQDLATAAAYAELSWKNLCSLRAIETNEARAA